MEDEFYDKITWDENSQWSGTMTLANGTTATVELDSYEPITEAARNTLRFLIANEPLIRHKIAVSTRRLCDDTWFYEDKITPEELAQKINLNHADIFDEGGGNLSYTADDDLFAGHWVVVLIDANGEIGEPNLDG